ncbi:Protein dlpA [Termitomyces sp. T112]|nr:Protein dlpA [Termitomyces sp. T112]
MLTRLTSPLVQFSTCEISDALIKLGLPHGGHIPDIGEMFACGRNCGPAYTVRMVDASNTIAPRLESHFLDIAPRGHFIVIEAPSYAKNAVWGELMTAGAQARDAVGVIISGRCRDVQDLQNRRLPIYARGHSTLGQSTFTRPSEVNIPLVIHPQGSTFAETSFPSVTIEPEDWMVADRDGVVCVPKALESQVIELAAKGKVVDESCLNDILNGKGVSASFKAHRGS